MINKNRIYSIMILSIILLTIVAISALAADTCTRSYENGKGIRTTVYMKWNSAANTYIPEVKKDYDTCSNIPDPAVKSDFASTGSYIVKMTCAGNQPTLTVERTACLNGIATGFNMYDDCGITEPTCDVLNRGFYYCSNSGTKLYESCPIDQKCVDGTCKPQKCLANYASCDGNEGTICITGQLPKKEVCIGDNKCLNGKCVPSFEVDPMKILKEGYCEPNGATFTGKTTDGKTCIQTCTNNKWGVCSVVISNPIDQITKSSFIDKLLSNPIDQITKSSFIDKLLIILAISFFILILGIGTMIGLISAIIRIIINIVKKIIGWF